MTIETAKAPANAIGVPAESVSAPASMAWESRTLDLGTPVHYADFGGRGPLMVLVHGIASSHLNWMTIAPALTRRARVLAVDLPGYGLSPLAPEPARVETSADYLDRFIDRMSGGEAVTLFGHSMGGLVSMLEAGAHPEKVSRLILMSPAAPVPRRALVSLMALPFLLALVMPRRTAKILRSRGARLDADRVVRRALKAIIGPTSTVPEEVVQAHVDLLTRQRREQDWTENALVQSAGSLIRMTSRRRAYRELVRRVAAPTLLMHGTKDRLVPYGAGLWLHRRRPDWAFQPMEGLGHMPNFEDPDWVLWTVNEWLDAHPVAAEAG